jgi:hypothetical protein
MQNLNCVFVIDSDAKSYFKKRAKSKTASEIKMVEEKGRVNTFPNNLKRKSPGNRPIPSFSNQGSKAENTVNAIKITATQRIIFSLLN